MDMDPTPTTPTYYDDKKKKRMIPDPLSYDPAEYYDDKKKKRVIQDSLSYNPAEYYDDKKKKRLVSDNSYYDKKKKRMVHNFYGKHKRTIYLDKKKKRILNLAGVSESGLDEKTKKRLYMDSMKENLCDIRYGNFLDIDVSDRTPYWGVGIEHEMQLFHKSSAGMKNTNIMFDSQESSCFLTDDTEACCKTKRLGKCDDFKADALNYNMKKNMKDFGLTKEEKQYILRMQWELTGRQIRNCKPNKPITELIRRTPILMPELITTNHTNRTIDSIWKEIIALEDHYINIHMKNPHTKQKVNKYGPLTTHLCGSHSEIQVPIRPTIYSKEYKFEPKLLKDYVGSYHMTITLPHTRDILIKDYIKMHQNMAQQIQWLEPLLMTAFFSSTQSAVGDNSDPEGSFRVMSIGWGSFGGSNVRRIGTKGLDRGSNIRQLWRRGLNFKGTKKLNLCAEMAPPQYKKSKTIHTGDFRTFGSTNLNLNDCAKLYNRSDCLNGKIDGAPLRPPFGLEIRIFDHFPSEYLLDLMRIMVLIGCNAQCNPAKEYVYRDKRWINAVRAIMRDGWNSNVESSYVSALRKNLGLPIKTNSLLAYDVFKTIVHELFEVNKDEFINKIMNENPYVEPVVPEINRMCWDMAFTQKFNIQVINFLKHNFHNGQTLTVEAFKKTFKENGPLDYSYWENEINDLLYALETHNHVQLELFNGKIKTVKILL